MDWQTLAPELIFEILGKVLPGLTLPVIDPKLFPWYLGHICSSWRAVFKSSPRFWSALVIDLDGDGVEIPPNHRIERALLLTEMCIQQSKAKTTRYLSNSNLRRGTATIVVSSY
ncbi:hypothetical protein M378DRAFT_170685 [Amanita muscaria Koide BX008]|uniref:F-box domain-containing protein n=1 Tax=Amanita muscaria (strain Koide BX008) TaxID=946122 RepID=A0A0C2S6G9_AMAMK|nr:hypothetical protein M378DRAFT_170685 [Amanita muscaria Koide BX008]